MNNPQPPPCSAGRTVWNFSEKLSQALLVEALWAPTVERKFHVPACPLPP